jgi:hypothetical protein
MKRLIGSLLAATALVVASPAAADVQVSGKVVVGGKTVNSKSPLSPVTLELAKTGRRNFQRAGGEYCWTYWARWDAKTKSAVEIRVGSAKMTRRWCYNGTRVTRLVFTRIDHWVTNYGTFVQVEDRGICCRSSRWTSWHQTYHGGHVERAGAQFHQAVPTPFGEIGIADWYLTLKIEVYGNGKNNWSDLDT